MNIEKGALELCREKIYINFNIGVTLYFGAVRKCSREIFYLKKFLLACGTIGLLAILGCETPVINLGEVKAKRFQLFEPEDSILGSPGTSLRFIKKGFRASEK